jgi:hypothetical protein
MSPPSVFAALAAGARHTARYWPLVLLLFALNGCAALTLTATGRDLLSPLAARPDAWDAAGGIPWRAMNELGLAAERGTAGARTAPFNILMTLVGLLLALIGSGVAGVVLLPGILATFFAAPAPLSGRRLLAAAARWAPTFGLFWLIDAIVTPLAWLAALLVGISLLSGGGAPAFALLLALAWLASSAITALSEYARIAAIVTDRRDPWALLGLAARLIRRRPAVLFGVYLLWPLLGLALLAAYGLAVEPAAAALPVAVLVALQQLVVLTRIALRQWRLASETELARALERASAEPAPQT